MDGRCRLTGAPLIEVMDLGSPCVSDFLDRPGVGTPFPLKLGLGADSGLLQLFEGYPPASLYGKYWYQSGINESMRLNLSDIVASAQAFAPVGSGDVVLDIGCNDGTLLGNWPHEAVRLGIDPAENLAPLARRNADAIATEFFSAEGFRSLEPRRRAKVITSIAMFYDIEDPHRFVDDIRSCLDPDGLWVLELAYAPMMLQQNAFDCVCHEHLCYYSLTVMDSLLAAHDLRIVDVRLNNVNGCSFRLFVAQAGARLAAPTFDLDVGAYRRRAYLALEQSMELLTPRPYVDFLSRVEREKEHMLAFLRRVRDEGRSVIGYGASTKGNTLLQYYGITPGLLPAIADRSPAKHGKFTAGTGIPIISEQEMRSRRPDYLLALPWHFIPSFLDRERDLVTSGTRFVVPLPEFRIFEA